MTMTIEPSDCLRTGIVSLHLPAPWPPCRRRCLPLGHFTSGHKVTDRLPGAFVAVLLGEHSSAFPWLGCSQGDVKQPCPSARSSQGPCHKGESIPQCSCAPGGSLSRDAIFATSAAGITLPGPQIFPTSSTPHLTLLVDQLPSRCTLDGSHFPFGQRT